MQGDAVKIALTKSVQSVFPRTFFIARDVSQFVILILMTDSLIDLTLNIKFREGIPSVKLILRDTNIY